MITYPPAFTLSDPAGDEAIPNVTLAYFQARHRSRIYEAILREFLKSGITQASLARRMGKRPEQVNRMLGAPGNWTLDTVSDLLFAISGAEPVYGVRYPLWEPPRNFRQPEWLSQEAAPATSAAERYALVQQGFGASATSDMIPIFAVRGS